MLSQTENGAIAHSSTNSSLLDLFVKSVRGCSKETIYPLMLKSWNESPETLLKLLCLTRDPRSGKGERDVSTHMINFIKKYAPLTYEMNLRTLTEKYGRIEDLLVYSRLEDSSILELTTFEQILNEDLNKSHPSLAVKWAPREQSFYHKEAVKLANMMFSEKPLENYRKKVINALSQKVKTVEQQMSSKEWDKIDYEKLPSLAMAKYGKNHVRNNKMGENKPIAGAFLRNDNERFTQYQTQVKAGEKKINTGGITADILIKHIWNAPNETTELQWAAMIDKLKKSNNFKSSMALIDVSGSMAGQPMEVAIALGLIISELSNGPYKNRFITFESNPQMLNVQGNTLHEKVKYVKTTPWGGSTNIEAAFDLILNTAVNFKLSQNEMPETLFIFTDMQFNSAFGKSASETLFETIGNKFKAQGYKLPKIVFWNLRDSSKDAFPIQSDINGYAYVSGFSQELLKVFMEGYDFTPMTILNNLLEKYNDVFVDDSENKKITFCDLI